MDTQVSQRSMDIPVDRTPAPAQVSGVDQQARRWRSVVISVGIALLALLVAAVGGLLTGTGVGAVTGFVESMVAASNTFLGNAADLIPLGYAFGAGMVATVNPCGFAMLPAYLGLYLGTGDARGQEGATLQRVGQALVVSVLVTAGFVLLFGVAGLLISAGARAIIGYMPWVGLAIGVLLVGTGAWILGGGNLYLGVGDRLAAEVGRPNQTSVKGYFLFGLSYGLASLSCTLPVFLTVVGGTVAASGFLGASFQFVMYALGMGFVILLLTLGMALFKEAVVGTIRRGLPYVKTVSAILLIVAGAYIVYYWLTLGGLLRSVV
ncbi:MAG: cytochrome c biogenesis CcdA family protein [Anaerolineae bacterium]